MEDPTPCAAGTYNELEGQTDESACLPCPVGSFCPDEGMSSPTTCSAGHYCESTQLASATPCDAGKYNELEGQSDESVCLDCPIGSYCPDAGMPTPTACAAGYYCETTLMTQGTPCEQLLQPTTKEYDCSRRKSMRDLSAGSSFSHQATV